MSDGEPITRAVRVRLPVIHFLEDEREAAKLRWVGGGGGGAPQIIEGIGSRDEHSFWRSLILNTYFLYMHWWFSNFLFTYCCWKTNVRTFSLLIWNYLLILKILSVALFRESKAAILTLKASVNIFRIAKQFQRGKYVYRGRILGRNPDKSLTSFLLAIHSHLYSFALRYLFLQTHTTSYSF